MRPYYSTYHFPWGDHVVDVPSESFKLEPEDNCHEEFLGIEDDDGGFDNQDEDSDMELLFSWVGTEDEEESGEEKEDYTTEDEPTSENIVQELGKVVRRIILGRRIRSLRFNGY